MEERLYWLGFSVFPGVGPSRFATLLGRFDTASNAWNASKKDLQDVLGDALGEKFEKFRRVFSVQGYEKVLREKNVSFLILRDKEYPARLKDIGNAPFTLFVRGHFDLNTSVRTIAIVGTRKMTQYGRNVTELLTQELVNAGFTTVSGLAIGVDAISHKITVENGGKTIAVLGCGVDCCTPTSNKHIYNSILENGGAIVSELPLGYAPTKGSFPSRNRIIAGLSDAVLVTEGAADSGALITAAYALKFGRKVFAVPGPITSSLSKGPYKLIQKGATLVTTAEDIIGSLGSKSIRDITRKKRLKGDTKEEETILELLEHEPLHFDQIVRKIGIDPAKIGSILSMLEMKGIIRSENSGVFILSL